MQSCTSIIDIHLVNLDFCQTCEEQRIRHAKWNIINSLILYHPFMSLNWKVHQKIFQKSTLCFAPKYVNVKYLVNVDPKLWHSNLFHLKQLQRSCHDDFENDFTPFKREPSQNINDSRLNIKILSYFSISETVWNFSWYLIRLFDVSYLTMLINIKKCTLPNCNYKNAFLFWAIQGLLVRILII